MIKKSKHFIENFQIFTSFLVQTRTILHAAFLIFHAPVGSIRQIRCHPGAAAPGPPAGGGGVIAFKWPGRLPKRNPGDAVGDVLLVIRSSVRG